MSILLGTYDQRMLVFRNGVQIGRAPLETHDLPALGTAAFVLLDGTPAEPSPVLPDRPALRWLALPSTPPIAGDTLRGVQRSGRLRIPQAFAAAVRELPQPGATVILTDQALAPAAGVRDRPRLAALNH